jgi:phosphatidyl-myo-inositol alpha-mannosyltransferase
VRERPDLKLVVAGRGDEDEFLKALPRPVAKHVEMLGMVNEADKASLLRSVDVYCAPNTGQESFGVILLEAMAAHAPVVASDIDAFRRVLGGGSAGELFKVGDPGSLASSIGLLLDDPARRRRLATAGAKAVAPFDWAVIVQQVLRVYELAIAGASAPLR